MPEVNEYIFSFQELVEALVKKQGLHEGLWSINVRFALTAASVGSVPGAPIAPAAIVPIQSIGIVKVDEPTNLTVDAAEVNPAPKKAKQTIMDRVGAVPVSRKGKKQQR
jgi:hypothetical protein